MPQMSSLFGFPRELRDRILHFALRGSHFVARQNEYYYKIIYVAPKCQNFGFTRIPLHPAPRWMFACKQLLLETREQFYLHAICHSFSYVFEWGRANLRFEDVDTLSGVFALEYIRYIELESTGDTKSRPYEAGIILDEPRVTFVNRHGITHGKITFNKAGFNCKSLTALTEFKFTTNLMPKRLTLDVSKLRLREAMRVFDNQSHDIFDSSPLVITWDLNLLPRLTLPGSCVEFVFGEPELMHIQHPSLSIVHHTQKAKLELKIYTWAVTFMQRKLEQLAKHIIGGKHWSVRDWLDDQNGYSEVWRSAEEKKTFPTKSWHLEVKKSETIDEGKMKHLGLWQFHQVHNRTHMLQYQALETADNENMQWRVVRCEPDDQGHSYERLWQQQRTTISIPLRKTNS